MAGGIVSSVRPGHRARLRQRFLAGGPRAFLDHEVLEMLLAQVDQRRDTKPRAYALIDAFASDVQAEGERPRLGAKLARVLLQTAERLVGAGVPGVGPAMALHLAAVRSASARVAEAQLMDAPVLGNWEAVVAYSNLRFATEIRHQTHVLFLDFRHRLMRQPEAYSPDTSACDFARLVVEAALRRAASGLIVVRHDPDRPASARPLDFEQADRLKTAGAANAVSLHDFMLLSPMGHMSLRSMGLLEVAPDYQVEPDLFTRRNSDGDDGWFAREGETLDQLQRRADADGVDRLTNDALLALLLRRAVGDGERREFVLRLLGHYGGLGRVLAAPLEELADAVNQLPFEGRPETPEVLAVHLGVIGEAVLRLLRGQMLASPVLTDLPSLVRYCRAALGYDEVEQFRVLYLDKQHRLVWDEAAARGTVNHAPVQPREVAARALRLKASALVLVHNHPTGDAEPSRADIDMTRQIVEACGVVGVQVLDHLIVAETGHTSLGESGNVPGLSRPGAKPRRRQRKRA